MMCKTPCTAASSNSICLIIFMMLEHASSFNPIIDFHNNSMSGVIFQSIKPVIITNSQWKIITQFNFSEFQKDIEILEEMVIQLDRDYNEYNSSYPTFHIELDKIKISLDNFLASADHLLALFPEHRSKRGIFNFVGDALSFLFGTVSDSQLQEINKQFDQMSQYAADVSNNQYDHLTLVKNLESQIKTNANRLTTIIDSFINMTEILNDTFDQSNKELNFKLKQSSIYNYLSTHFRQIELILTDAHLQLQNFHAMLYQTARGHLYPTLMSPSKLLSVLRNISTILPDGYSLLTTPSVENLYLFYQQASVKAAVTGTTLYVYISFDIHNKYNVFKAFQPTLYPIYFENVNQWITFTEQNDILLISHDNQYYLTISKQDYDICHTDKITSCHINPQLTSINYPNCLINLYKNSTDKCQRQTKKLQISPYLHRIQTDVIYSTNQPTFLTLQCNDSIHTVNISGHGLIRNVQNCTITSNAQQLRPTMTGSTVLTKQTPKIIIPKLHNQLFSIEEHKLLTFDINTTRRILDDLRRNIVQDNSPITIDSLIDSLREKEAQQRFHRMAISSVGGSFGVILFLIITLPVILCCRCTPPFKK